jgi:pimeloyl-ACP methyl ester carboxylesterase
MLAHEVAGTGPTVLLLHAGVCDSGMWRIQKEALSARCTVVTVDLRGYGQSPVPSGCYCHARDVLDVLAGLGVHDLAVVGSSLGAGVALQLASTDAVRIRRLVLLNAPDDRVEPTDDLLSFVEQERALLAAGDLDAATELNVCTWLGPDAGPDVRDEVRRMQRRAFDLQVSAAAAEETELPVDPARVTARTLILSGAYDLEYFRASARLLAATIRHARHVELAWAGHLPSLERPEEIGALLERVLAEDA